MNSDSQLQDGAAVSSSAWFGDLIRFSRWAGDWTFRCEILNRLWFGANLRTLGWFIIYNGKLHNWQITAWPIRAYRWKTPDDQAH